MLKLRNSANPAQAIWLVEPKVVLGSSSGSDVVLSADDVSPSHLEINIKGEDLQLRVLAEGAAVTVNGSEVVKGAAAVTLRSGDVIAIDQQSFEVIDPKQRPAAAPAPSKNEADESVSSSKNTDTGWALKANHSALANRVYSLSETTLVGRSNECDIVLAAAHLSRKHALLSVRNDKLHVKDLDSANGTFVNGKQITEAWVRRGDQLKFDTLSFGVMGPAEEMDKTSVRAVSPELLKAAEQAKAAASTASRASNAGNGKTTAARKATPEAVAPAPKAAIRAQPVEVKQTPTGRRFAVGLGLLVIIAAGAFVLMRG